MICNPPGKNIIAGVQLSKNTLDMSGGEPFLKLYKTGIGQG